MEKMWEFDYRSGQLGITLMVSAATKEEAIAKFRDMNLETNFSDGEVSGTIWLYPDLPLEDLTDEFECVSEEEEL